MNPNATEGVIRYRYTLRSPDESWQALARTDALPELSRAHAQGLACGCLGRDPARYDGLAYGNLSLRRTIGTGRDAPGAGEFWVTASQRIDQPVLQLEDLVRIDAMTEDGQVSATGSLAPSSETLTHAAVHAAALRGPLAVLHGHDRSLWQMAHELGWATTPPGAGNGTRAIAVAVTHAVTATPANGALAMLGHEDGILLWAPNFADIFAVLADARTRGRAQAP